MALRFTLRQLEYFVAVAESGSIVGASARLNVSPPPISTAISDLEAQFGIQLFIRRHARGLSLTPGGRRFLDKARVVLKEADGLHELAADITGRIGGPLSVGCLMTFAQHVLPQLRRSFSAMHPDVDLRQTECDQADLFDGLRQGRIDIALTYDLNIPSDLSFVPLVTLPPYAIFPTDHHLAGRSVVTPSDLSRHPMVLLDLPMSADYFLSIFESAGTAPNIVERTRDISVMRSLVANGFGYSIINVRPLTDLSPDGLPLVSVPIAGPVRPMKLGLLAPSGAHAPLTVLAFSSHARQMIRPGQAPGIRVD